MARTTFNESLVINKAEKLEEMGTKSLVKTLCCGGCAMLYKEYKQLLEHLYWRHGTESTQCRLCGLQQWKYAPHECHVLPINNEDVDCGSPVPPTNSTPQVNESIERDSEFCFCGRFVEDSQMIGCDDPRCSLQWYHFKCVGIQSPPDGDWFCAVCLQNAQNIS